MANDSPFPIASGYLSNGLATIFTCPSGSLIGIDNILIVNNDSVVRTFTVYVTRNGFIGPVTPNPVTLGVGALYQIPFLTLGSGDLIQVQASVNTILSYVINARRFL
jgi:hypothetical protein